MTCTPLSIAKGLFLSASWSTAPMDQSNGRSVSLTASGLTAIDSSSKSVFHTTLGANVTKYMFFGMGRLLVLERQTSTPASVWVSVIDFGTSPPIEKNILQGAIDGPGTDDPVVQHSQGNGDVFLLFNANASGPTGVLQNMAIHRSDNGDVLCSGPAPFHPEGETLGEATATKLIIHYNDGSSQTEECDLPKGKCTIAPLTLSFSELVVGGPPGTETQTKTVMIKNTGNDCLIVQSVANSGPYTTDFAGQVVLSHDEEIPVKVTFTPNVVGTFNNMTLAVTTSPVNGDSVLTCNGKARNPVKKISFNPPSVDFKTQPVNSTNKKQIAILNSGELPLIISVVADSGVFTWAGFNSESLPVGNSRGMEIEFKPPSIGNHSTILTVKSDAPGSPHMIKIIGKGCLMEPAIDVAGGPLSFGEVQQKFRAVRYLLVRNPGSGQLVFHGRISGVNASLFGIQKDSGSITDVEQDHDFSVYPVTPCGVGITGSGEVPVAVAFFANQAPGVVSAELIIENHNVTTAGTPASWTIPLTATIVEPVDVDAALVLDRSGSMGDVVGSRSKSEASITAGRLFVDLIRPDVQDRIATVKFNTSVAVLQGMDTVTSSNQPGIVSQINGAELKPEDSTSVAGGVLVALKELTELRSTPSDSLNKLVLVLTDGKDNTPYFNPDDSRYYGISLGTEFDFSLFSIVFPLKPPADVKIYAVGIGKTEEIDEARLGILAQSTGAYFGIVNKDLEGVHYFDVEKFFTQVFMDAVDLSMISDPVVTIQAGETHEIPFEILRGDVSGLVVVYDKLGKGRLPFYLKTSTGEIMDVTMIPPGFQLRPGITETARFIEFKLPVPNSEKYEGTWHLIVKHPGKLCRESLPGYSTSDFGFVGKSCYEHNDPVDYGYSIAIGSNLRMHAYVTPGVVKIGDPIHLTAIVAEAGLPILNCTVTVCATSPSGTITNLVLHDDGTHGDTDADDGEYVNDFKGTYETGGYEFLFRAVGYSRDGEPIVREALRGKYVEGNQQLIPDPGRPGVPGDPSCCQRANRLLLFGVLLLMIIVALLLGILSKIT